MESFYERDMGHPSLGGFLFGDLAGFGYLAGDY